MIEKKDIQLIYKHSQKLHKAKLQEIKLKVCITMFALKKQDSNCTF